MAKPISVITGIDSAALPPPDRLTDAHTIFLCDEMIHLLNACCFYTDFPKGLSVDIRYKLLRLYWEEKIVYIGEGITCFEFCEYETDWCPYPEEFYHCKDLDDIDGFDDFDDFDGE